MVLIHCPKIRAEVHTDDYAYTAKFDASPFFESASEEEVIQLAQTDWGGDYPADDVARHFTGIKGYEDVTAVLNDAATRKTGFECNVHEADVMVWLKEFRPQIFKAVCAAIDADSDDPIIQGRDPFWDEDPSWAGSYQLPESMDRPGQASP